eukprot:14652897-Heterocapsa_arctica.AAC.1
MTFREWSAVRADPTLLGATVARLFVIMGRKGDEMENVDGRSSEVKYKARGGLSGEQYPIQRDTRSRTVSGGGTDASLS